MASLAPAIKLIKAWEGFYPKPYRCPAGVPTIGYGTTVYSNGKRVTMEDKAVTPAEAEDMLEQHVEVVAKEVDRLVKQPLTTNQRCALISFTYNVGIGNLERSTLLKRINRNPGDRKLIKREFLKWVNAKGRFLLGLQRRRQQEVKLYNS